MNETVLQFGSGKFLRAFADLFVHHANQQGQNIGKIVIVQSTGGERANELAKLVKIEEKTSEPVKVIAYEGIDKGAIAVV